MFLPPEKDIQDRMVVWTAMENFWLDTNPDIRLELSAKICANSKYNMEALESIFYDEVHPALKFNLLDIAGEWADFHSDFLKERILEKHRFGKVRKRDLFFQKHLNRWWTALSCKITQIRASEHADENQKNIRSSPRRRGTSSRKPGGGINIGKMDSHLRGKERRFKVPRIKKYLSPTTANLPFLNLSLGRGRPGASAAE